MATYQETRLQEIADAIRSANGSTDNIQGTLFKTKIHQLKRYMYQDNVPSYCEPKAQEAVYVARTYWTARARGRAFYYTTSGKTFLNGNNLNNSSGAGIIDCSTYIHLVMRGIPYDKSPYAINTSANATYDPSNLVTNTSEYTWADDNIRNSETIGGQVRFAADLAAYYWSQGRCFTDPSLRKPGDLIFHSTKDNERFMSITHVSIVDEDISKYYNVTDIEGLVIVRTEYANRHSDIVFFARPDYENIAKQTYTFNPNFNYLAAPWIDPTKTVNGVTYTVNEDAGTIVSAGSATNGSQFDLISRSYPLYLPAGTYHLSGAPARLDRGSRVNYSYWGLRLYPSDGRTITSQVKGFNSSTYTEANLTTVTQSQAYVWDKGYGADFTIDTGMVFYASIYISKNVVSSSVYTGPDTWIPMLVRTA